MRVANHETCKNGVLIPDGDEGGMPNLPRWFHQLLTYSCLYESTHLAKRKQHKEQWYKPVSQQRDWITDLRANWFPRQLQYPVNDNKIKSIDSNAYIYIFCTVSNYPDTCQSPTWALCQVEMITDQYARS
jgi:hypothetical protein